jgi:hypothetical protein
MATSGSIRVRIVPALGANCGPAAARRGGARPRKPGRAWGLEALEGRVVPATITVMNMNDSGAGSLRAAIEQADMDTSPDTIDFAPAVTGTITLLTALPDLSADITIAGTGASALAVARSADPATPAIAAELARMAIDDALEGRRPAWWRGPGTPPASGPIALFIYRKFAGFVAQHQPRGAPPIR